MTRGCEAGLETTVARLSADWKPYDKNCPSSRRTNRCSRWSCATSSMSVPSALIGGSNANARTGASRRQTWRFSPFLRRRVRMSSKARAQVGSLANASSSGSSLNVLMFLPCTFCLVERFTPKRAKAMAMTCCSSPESMPTALRDFSRSVRSSASSLSPWHGAVARRRFHRGSVQLDVWRHGWRYRRAPDAR